MKATEILLVHLRMLRSSYLKSEMTSPLLLLTCLCLLAASVSAFTEEAESLSRVRRATCGSGDCQHDGVCVSNSSSPYCLCPKPYTGVYCAEILNFCTLSQPDKGINVTVAPVCLNGATCTGTTLTDPYFHCNCVPGYNGSRCETNINECAPNPCVNGLCTDQVNNYTCSCYTGWEGRNCQINHNDCPAGVCHNGGFCVDGNVTFTCNCSDTGYTGTYCDNDVNECVGTGNPCLNGICTNLIGSYNCSCYRGWEGRNCQINHNDCTAGSCLNSGRCVDGNSSVTCDCSSVDYSGANCTSWINDCLPNPCLNGGTCSDGVRNFSCNCTNTGFYGPTCSSNVDDCASGPCLHGLCIDLLKNYSCNCTDSGFYGRNCESNVDDCSPNPCRNGGSCSDRVKDFNCSCHDGYSGKDCSVDTPDCSPNPCRANGSCLERSSQVLYGVAGLPAPFNGAFDFSSAAEYVCYYGPEAPALTWPVAMGIGIGICVGVCMLTVMLILNSYKNGKIATLGCFEPKRPASQKCVSVLSDGEAVPNPYAAQPGQQPVRINNHVVASSGGGGGGGDGVDSHEVNISMHEIPRNTEATTDSAVAGEVEPPVYLHADDATEVAVSSSSAAVQQQPKLPPPVPAKTSVKSEHPQHPVPPPLPPARQVQQQQQQQQLPEEAPEEQKIYTEADADPDQQEAALVAGSGAMAASAAAQPGKQPHAGKGKAKGLPFGKKSFEQKPSQPPARQQQPQLPQQPRPQPQQPINQQQNRPLPNLPRRNPQEQENPEDQPYEELNAAPTESATGQQQQSSKLGPKTFKQL